MAFHQRMNRYNIARKAYGNPHSVRTIISGGQTGADQGGLAAGVSLGLGTGGWAPRGWRVEGGSAPYLAGLGLREHSSSSYPPRTAQNVKDSDGTLVFGNPNSAGSKLTVKTARQLSKPFFVVRWQSGQSLPSPAKFRQWLRANDISVLNVAGNRESRNPGITRAVHDFLVSALGGGSAPAGGGGPLAPRPAYARGNPGRIGFVQHYTRAQIKAEPRWLFVFGDNMTGAGLGGQAKAARGETNAVGIPTKWLPSRSAEAYFTDADFPKVKPRIDEAFQKLADHVAVGGDVVWPVDREGQSSIGTGRAELEKRAPVVLGYIMAKLQDLVEFSKTATPGSPSGSPPPTLFALSTSAPSSSAGTAAGAAVPPTPTRKKLGGTGGLEAIGEAFKEMPSGEVVATRDMVIYPINPASLAFAAEAYKLDNRAAQYTKKVYALLQALQKQGVDIVPLTRAGGAINEDALRSVIYTLLGARSNPKNGGVESLERLARELREARQQIAELEAERPLAPEEETELAELKARAAELLGKGGLFRIFPKMEDMLLYVQSIQAAAAKVPAIPKLAAEIAPMLGLQEEYEANRPFPNFGVLGGRGVLDLPGPGPGGKFFYPPKRGADDKRDRDLRFRDAVIGLSKKVEPALRGHGHGVQEVGRTPTGHMSAVFALSGKQTDAYGMTIMPLSSQREKDHPFLNTTVEGIVKKAIADGVWDSVHRQWAGALRFALPGPLVAGRGKNKRERTEALKFADFLCAPVIRYEGDAAGTDITLLLTFSIGRQRVRGTLTLGTDSVAVTGRFSAPDKAYILTSQSGVRVVYKPEGEEVEGTVTLPGQGAIPFTALAMGSGRECPSPEFKTAFTNAVESLVAGVPGDLGAWVAFYIKALHRIGQEQQAAALADLRSRIGVCNALADLRHTLEQVARSGVVPRGGEQEGPLPRGAAEVLPPDEGSRCEPGPVLLSGFPNAPETLQPLTSANIEAALGSEAKGLRVASASLARAIGIKTPGKYKSVIWQRQPGKFYVLRLTLTSAAKGAWNYTFAFGRKGDQLQLSREAAAHVVHTEIQRSLEAAKAANQLRTKATQIISMYLSALVAPVRGKSPLDNLQVVFMGTEEAEDDVPRFLSGEDWYGDNRQARALALTRGQLRERLSGHVAEPPTLSAMAHSREEKYVRQRKQIQWGREKLNQNELSAFLTAKDREVWEDTAWKMGKTEEKTKPLSIPLVWEDSPLGEALVSAVFTVYGMAGAKTFTQAQVGEHRNLAPLPGVPGEKVDLQQVPEYRPLWQKRYTRAEMAAIVKEAEMHAPAPPPGGVFNPAYALRAHIARASGMADQADKWAEMEAEGQGKLPVPFSIVGAFEVKGTKIGEFNRIAASKKKKKLPAFYTLAESDSGLYLNTFRIPTRKDLRASNVPDLDELLSVYSSPVNVDGLFPSPVARMTIKLLSEFLVQVEWNPKTRQLMPLRGSLWGRKNLFGYSEVSRTSKFRDTVEKIVEGNAERKKPKVLVADDLANLAYTVVLSQGLKGFFGGGTPEQVFAGRAAFYTYKGTQAQAKRIAGQIASPSAAKREWATKAARSFANVFTFASYVCQETGCVPSLRGRRVKIAGLLSGIRTVQFTEREVPAEDQEGILSGEENALLIPPEAAARVRKAMKSRGKEPTTIYTQLPTSRPERLYEIEVLEDQPDGPQVIKLTERDLRAEEAPSLDEEGKEKRRRGVSTAGAHKLFSMMVSLGIKVPDPSDLPALKAALEELKEKAKIEYRHRANLGNLKAQLDPEQIAAKRAVAQDAGFDPALRVTEEEQADELESIALFAEDYLDEMAKPNRGSGGRGRWRKPRKPRKPRGWVRRNPLTKDDVLAAREYWRTDKAPEDLEKALAELRGEDYAKAAQWPITQDKLQSLFPRKGGLRPDTWSPRERLPELERVDLVTRVGKLPFDPEAAEAADAGAMPFSPVEGDDPWVGLDYTVRQAGLSLEETKQMLADQRLKRRSPYTMSASSALCKQYRSRKLTTYTPPPELLAGGRNDDVVIWMSPAGDDALRPRVMTFRRGTWVDCDMISDNPLAMSELLGKALQSSLYWLAEKPRRGLTANLWVGRVGDSYLYLAHSAGQRISLNQASKNLKRGMGGGADAEGYKISLYTQSQEGERDAQEVKRYQAAVKSLFRLKRQARSGLEEEFGPGARAKKVTPRKPAPPVPPAEVPTIGGEGGEDEGEGEYEGDVEWGE